ncbi:MAG: ABC-ATPase domain-containing protein [Actinobacteria bacterium]|nr:ABC-ATPase domain-containing protein [Actinomycetota bacterium]
MRDSEELRRTLRRIDGRGYKAYKDIEGQYDFGSYVLWVEHVQGDPFAAPSNVIVRVPQEKARFPRDTFSNRSREIGLRDYLTRRFHDLAERVREGKRGSGKSGLIAIDRPHQEILERTSVLVDERWVEARIAVGLPAYGRSIAGREAEEMFFRELPHIVAGSLFFDSLDRGALYRHVETNEDADCLRGKLREMGLAAFLADGAVLPRRSGVDPRPLTAGRVIPFKSPPSLRVEVELPNRGRVSGMGIPAGITLIVGGGYHGKSTVLNALELGVYNHIPGDGRELVVADPGAVKIRAEDGRRIEKVDISPFIRGLPFGQDTTAFCTDNASGSTSQAANIIEALEVGATLLLIDEDTSATNFMIRDERMQKLVPKEFEPITPFIDKADQLFRDYGVSVILVIGGSGDYFDIAHHVICMVNYEPRDVTERARAIAADHVARRVAEGGETFGTLKHRVPLARSVDPQRRGKTKIRARGVRAIEFGGETIDLSSVEQLVDESQTRAIGHALHYATRYMDGKATLREVVERVMGDVGMKGLDVIGPPNRGDYAAFRAFELAAAMNRLRTFTVKT